MNQESGIFHRGLVFGKLATPAWDTYQHIEILRKASTIEEVLVSMKFWFFQHRASFMQQKFMARWDPEHLDAYILRPTIIDGFANKRDCFISHYWRTPQHPDPEGEDMRDFRRDLGELERSYIWVDCTCLPQAPRTKEQTVYFKRMLRYLPTLIRDCAMEYRYPPFEPRGWILLEVAYYFLGYSGKFETPKDAENFLSHIAAMCNEGGANSVKSLLSKYGYRCTNDSDLYLVTGRLELLVILTRIFRKVAERRWILNWIEKEGLETCTFS